MRVAQYFVLVIFGVGGIFVAHYIGLIGVDMDYVRASAPLLDFLVAFPNLVAPFVAGSFASIGAISVFNKFWCFLRVARQSQPNGG